MFIDLLPLFNLFEQLNCQLESFKGDYWNIYLFGKAYILQVHRNTELSYVVVENLRDRSLFMLRIEKTRRIAQVCFFFTLSGCFAHALMN